MQRWREGDVKGGGGGGARERQAHTERQRETETETERQRDGERGTEKGGGGPKRETCTHRVTYMQRKRWPVGRGGRDRQRQTETKRETETETQKACREGGRKEGGGARERHTHTQ